LETVLGSHSFKLFFSSATLAVSARAQAQIAFQEPFDTPETVYRSCLDMQAFQQEVLRVHCQRLNTRHGDWQMTLEEYFQYFGSGFAGGPLFALPVALLDGIVAGAVCPCTLPVGLGVAGVSGASETQSRRSGFMIATAFFAGIVVNLTVLGALAGRLGRILTESFGQYWTLVMALLSLIAAILAFWGPRLKSYQLAALRKPGIAGAFYGFIFSLGTSAAPLLLFLTVAASYAGTGMGWFSHSRLVWGEDCRFSLLACSLAQ
jgi:cytochrome c-type biogenesis protein